MIIEKKGTTTIVTQEKATIVELVAALTKKYDTLKNDNIIVNLFSLKKITSIDIAEFLLLSRKHKKAKYSFVIVNGSIAYNEAADEITITPTLQEAHDLIQMEEIERDLEL